MFPKDGPCAHTMEQFSETPCFQIAEIIEEILSSTYAPKYFKNVLKDFQQSNDQKFN